MHINMACIPIFSHVQERGRANAIDPGNELPGNSSQSTTGEPATAASPRIRASPAGAAHFLVGLSATARASEIGPPGDPVDRKREKRELGGNMDLYDIENETAEEEEMASLRRLHISAVVIKPELY